MEKYIKYAPLVLFCLTVGKLLFLTPTWEGVASVSVAGLLTGLYEWKNRDKQMEAIEAKLAASAKLAEERYNILASAVNTHAKAYEDIKTHVSSLNLARNLKPSAPTSIEKIF